MSLTHMATRSMPIAVMYPGFHGQLELGADAVGAGDQDRLSIAIQRQFKQGTEAAQPAKHTGAPRSGNRRLDAIDQAVSRVDIHAGVPVAEAGATGRGFWFFAHWRTPG